jgi:hypothetical protein
LLARFQWAWPDPIEFELGNETPRTSWAIEALDKLRLLDLRPGDPPSPVYIPLTEDGRRLLLQFGKQMQRRFKRTGGLLRSAYGKTRGTALRLALNLELLWWCGKDGFVMPPDNVSTRAFAAAAQLVDEYFMPMACRVYGDATAVDDERAAATTSARQKFTYGIFNALSDCRACAALTTSRKPPMSSSMPTGFYHRHAKPGSHLGVPW